MAEIQQCLYKPIREKELVRIKSDEVNKISSRKRLLRQIIVSSGIWNAFFMGGLSLGAPTVIIPQLRREANSTEAVSEEMASWISSIYGLASLPWFIIPIMSARIGRKYPFLIVNVFNFFSYIIFYCSNTAKYILIAEIFQGPLFACIITISVIIIAEYTSPKYRGLFLTLKSASTNWGIWTANALGTFFHWKTIIILGIICSLYNILTILCWCESPSWLATKYRYEECAKVHRWIKGKDEASEKELANLISSCEESREREYREKIKLTFFLKRFYKMTLDRVFYMPILLGMAILSLYTTSGKFVCTVYAIDIIKKMTSNESTAYTGMLILDGVTVFGMYIGCVVSNYVKRRTLFLTGSCGGIVFLLILALHSFLCSSKLIDENEIVSLTLLALYFLFISVGPIIMATSIYAELIPLRYRTAGMFIIGMFSQVVGTTLLKTAPKMFKIFGLHNAFLFYGILSGLLILCLFKCLPETKDKTLQEIEEYFVGKIRKDVLMETQPMYHKNEIPLKSLNKQNY